MGNCVSQNNVAQADGGNTQPQFLEQDNLPKPTADLLPSQKDFLNDLMNLIISKPQLTVILPKGLFNYLYKIYNLEYWTNNQREILIKLFVQYIKFSVSQLKTNSANQSMSLIMNFTQKFGKECYRIFNEVRMRNVWILQSLQYSNIFMNKTFLDKYENVLQTADQVRNLCSKTTLSLVYLSGYLNKCCEDLQKNKVSVIQINKKLQDLSIKLNQQFSPLKKIKQQKQYNKNRSFQQEELGKLKSQQFRFKMIKLAFKTDNKEKQLQDFIMRMVDLAKKHYSSFTELTSSCCLQSQGFAYKSNLKLRQRTQQMPLLRVKQKLLKDEIVQFYKNKTYENCNTLSQLRNAQIDYLRTVLKEVYSKMSEINFSVTDLLRGKCLFNKIAHINIAAQKIIKKVNQRASKGQNIQIVEIDNRLGKDTTDLVLKIRIQNIVCEFQLALKFNQAENQIYHKMYELKRSKVFTPVTMLYHWHNALVTDFFNNIDRILNQTQPYNKDNLINMTSNLKVFLQFNKITRPATIVEVKRQDIQYLKTIKSEINIITVSHELLKKMDLRAGKVLKQMKKYKDALQYLNKCNPQLENDVQFLLQLADTYRKIGKYKTAVPLYQKWLKLFEHSQSQKENIHKAYMQISQCYKKMEDLGKALGMLQMAQQFHKKFFCQKSAHSAQTLIGIGNLMKKLGQFKQAIRCLEEAISIYQNNKLTNQLEYGKAYLALAEAYNQNGIFSKALEYLHKSLSITQNLTSKESLETAEVIRVYGNVYQCLGKYEQTQQYYKKYLTMTQNLVSKDSMDYASSLFFLSNLYRQMERFKECQQILKQCERIIININGQESSQYMQIINSYGLYYLQLGQCDKAFQNFEKALKLLKQINEEKSPNMATLYGNIALAHHNQANYYKAIEYYEKQTILVQQLFGKQSNQACFASINIIALIIQLNQLQEAKQLLLQIEATYQKLGTQNSTGYLKSLEFLAHVQVKLDNISGAQKLYEKLLKIYEVTTGKESPQYAAVCTSIGELFILAYQQKDQGKQWYRMALDIYKKINHPKQKEMLSLIDKL